MSYVIAAFWHAAPGQEEVVGDALRHLAPASRAEPGNLRYVAHVSYEDPAAFFIYEDYADEDAFEAHLASSHFDQYARNVALPALDRRERFTFIPIHTEEIQ